MPLYIYRLLLRDMKLQLPTVFINGYNDSPVKHQESCTAPLLNENQVLQKAVFQVTDTKLNLILGHETAKQIGFLHFLRISSPKLTELHKAHAYLKVIIAKAPKQKQKSKMSQDLIYLNIQLMMVQYSSMERSSTYTLTKIHAEGVH